MKNLLCLTSLILIILVSLEAGAAPVAVDWQQGTIIDSNRKPIDIAVSPNKKRIFILTGDSVVIKNIDGKSIQTIPLGFKAQSIIATGDTLYLTNHDENVVRTLLLSYIYDIDTSDSPVLGAKDAPIVMVEFSDFQCPYCARIAPVLKKVVEQNKDVCLVFKHYPLRKHKLARQAAAAATAAGQQGKFWEYHDLLFKNAKRLNKDIFKKIAMSLGLDMKKFEADMRSKAVLDKIDKDRRDGRNAEVSGTPSLYINGRKVNKKSLEEITKIIEQQRKVIKAKSKESSDHRKQKQAN